MVAAGLHVNASASFMIPPDRSPTQEDHGSSSLRLKQLYDAFSLHAKNCLIRAFFHDARELKCSPRKASLRSFHALVRSVRRDLSLHGRVNAVGVAWWNEITDDLFSLLRNTDGRDEQKTSKPVSCGDVAKACSTLQKSLTLISGKK
jgi:hypothetical protein